LSGCAVVNIDTEVDTADVAAADALGVRGFVDLQLATLPSYPNAPALSCASVDEKCQSGADCL
jgi:hypothetical protein